jgi:hypothetical protein
MTASLLQPVFELIINADQERHNMKLAHCLRLVLILTCIGSPTLAWAWGEQGHVIVAKIAVHRLNATARRNIADLLDDRSIADPRIANWADQIKRSSRYEQKYPNNASWHFVDIPFDATVFDPSRDCRGDNCVIDRIEEFSRIARDTKISDTDRKEALFFLVHLIGDIHQPLHCAERNRDKGGNLVQVRYLGTTDHHANLHSVWDTHLVEEVMNHLSADDAADRLSADISDDDAKTWIAGAPKDWGWEAHQLAVQSAYLAANNSELPATGIVDIDAAYVAKATPVVKRQLQRGGVRLARVLNDVFGDSK